MVNDVGRVLTDQALVASPSSQQAVSTEGFDPSCDEEQCVTPDDIVGPSVIRHARDIMRHWTGTNCTFVDDDITALGILAGKAVRAGLHICDELPASMVAAINRHIASGTEAEKEKRDD